MDTRPAQILDMGLRIGASEVALAGLAWSCLACRVWCARGDGGGLLSLALHIYKV